MVTTISVKLDLVQCFKVCLKPWLFDPEVVNFDGIF